jgi:S1-C subfamily serine protease
MTSPKHLWSGDWEHESRAAQSSLPIAPPPIEEPPRPPAPDRPPPRRPSYVGRRIVVLGVLAALVVAGVVWAISSSSSTSSSSSSNSANTSTGPAPGTGLGTGTTPPAATPPPTSPQPGTTTNPTTGAQADSLGLQLALVPVNRVIVKSVVPGSAAALDGIGAGALLLTINGTRVTSPDQVNAILARLPKGARVVLQLVQGSEQLTATIQESSGP